MSCARLPYAEAGDGYPEASETVINVTNGTPIRESADDEPSDVRYNIRGDWLWPRGLPQGLIRLAFDVGLRDSHLRVGATPRSMGCRLVDGDALAMLHFGEAITVSRTVPPVRET